MTTTYWAPNQGSVAQVETYTFSAPSGAGNTYTATINGKSVTYTANTTDGLTAAAAATGLFNLLNLATGIPAEFTEITFANPSSGVVTATARVPGTPFANVSGASLGLVLSTGNGLANGIATVHTTPNASPSDVFDAQNWLRVTAPAPGVRALPQNGDDVIAANTSVPMLWNLGLLAGIQFATYVRWQSMTGAIGLPENNPNGYVEWRETYFKFSGPAGSVPAGGLSITLGFNSGSGAGPRRERYNVGSQQVTLQCLAADSAADEYGIRFLGVHTNNTIVVLGNVSLGIAMLPGETARLNNLTLDGSAKVGIGEGVTWTTSTGGTASAMTCYGGSATLNANPATLSLNNGCQATFAKDGLTWASITAQGGSNLLWLAGGTITMITMSTGCTLDKSQDARGLTITDHTIDGDTCSFVDPLNAIIYTNAGSVKQQVSQGPYQFTGTKTVKVT